jgi:hypothetical protein
MKKRSIDVSNEFILHGNSVHENSFDSNENGSLTRSVHGDMNIKDFMELDNKRMFD